MEDGIKLSDFILKGDDGVPKPLTLGYVLARADDLGLVVPFNEFVCLEINGEFDDISGPFVETRRSLWKVWKKYHPYVWETIRLRCLFHQGIWPVLTSQMEDSVPGAELSKTK